LGIGKNILSIGRWQDFSRYVIMEIGGTAVEPSLLPVSSPTSRSAA